MRGPRIVCERPGFAWRLRLSLVWGGAGFAAGATFWHLLGFWAFLSEVVPPEAHAALASTAAPVILVDANRCTSLTLDRSAKETIAHPCPGNGLALQIGADGDIVTLEQPHLQSTGYRAD